MSDIEKYIKKRSVIDPEFASHFQEGYENFKLGVLLREEREKSGLTQKDVAEKIGTISSTISKIENNADEVRLSLIKKYAEMLGKSIYIHVA